MLLIITVTCGTPIDVQFSTYTHTGVNEGDNVTYTCDIGYALADENNNISTATCGEDGDWAGVPTCVGKLIGSSVNLYILVVIAVAYGGMLECSILFGQVSPSIIMIL